MIAQWQNECSSLSALYARVKFPAVAEYLMCCFVHSQVGNIKGYKITAEKVFKSRVAPLIS